MDIQTDQPGYGLEGKVIAVTGGAGVLCAALCRRLAFASARLAILDVNINAADTLSLEIKETGGQAMALACDVTSKEDIEAAAGEVIRTYGRVDGLINGAGGNSPSATTSAEVSFFDLPVEALSWVVDLNLLGTIYACQVFGRLMVKQKSGIILNISSMNAFRPLSRIPAYSAAKAAVNNFTQWLAVHMAREYSPEIRVNAIAPGFFLTDQNRYLLVDAATGELTQRGQSIIDHTPMRRFGSPEDLLGTVLWLLSPASGFVNGITVPVDGGFSAFSGV